MRLATGAPRDPLDARPWVVLVFIQRLRCLRSPR
jgi:hypothetical protein